MSVKGTWPRPCSTTREELELRKRFMFGEITQDMFDQEYKDLMRKGLIKRNGRVINTLPDEVIDG